ncbi:probable V-type proton ATPase subunit H isoform X2 [Hordeum vulgare subsp. vulgare]|uniref:probable V-type proton ATPase subunit H isoform X2 n=1 Tax=Hordeum vulgare subsp. vulgare TaxID=112509 RepID=UPI001D1A3363|nr:probable V-type proton ATPase subunit H isoform X2 [Hordeum vulgare subsp. vulgare]
MVRLPCSPLCCLLTPAWDLCPLWPPTVLKRDIPWETYMSTKLITSTCLQLLRRYDHKPESQRGPLLDEEDDDAAINVSMIESRASQLQSFALNDFVAYA